MSHIFPPEKLFSISERKDFRRKYIHTVMIVYTRTYNHCSIEKKGNKTHASLK